MLSAGSSRSLRSKEKNNWVEKNLPVNRSLSSKDSCPRRKDPQAKNHVRPYSKKQDIEITAFWVSMLSWGLRKTIINKSKELFAIMGDSPYEFILYFLDYLQRYYRTHDSLEQAFTKHLTPTSDHVGNAISGFHDDFFVSTLDYGIHYNPLNYSCH